MVTATEATLAGTPRVPSDLVVCPRFLIDGTVLTTVALAARFDTSADVTIEELRIELFFAADVDTESFFRDS